MPPGRGNGTNSQGTPTLEPDASVASSGYNLRRSVLRFSKSKGPYYPKPLNPAHPPALASVAAQKRAEKAQAKTQATTTVQEFSNTIEVGMRQDGDSSTHNDAMHHTHPGQPMEPQGPTASSGVSQDLALASSQQAETNLDKDVASVADIEVVQLTPDRVNFRGSRTQDTGTPSCLNTGGPSITISIPTPLIIHTAPEWAMNFDESQLFRPFVPQASGPLPVLFTTFPAAPPFGSCSEFAPLSAHEGPGFGAPSGTNPGNLPFLPTNQTMEPPIGGAPAQSGFSNGVAPTEPIPGDSAHGSALAIPRAQHSALHSKSPSLERLHSAIAQSLHPMPGQAHLHAAPSARSRGPSPTPSFISRAGSIAPSSRGPSPAPSIPPNHLHPVPTVPGPVSPNLTSMGLGHVSVPSDADFLDYNSQTNIKKGRPPGLSYNQDQCIVFMTYRWTWYLLAKDTFPINTRTAQESCISYAEQILDTSRTVVNINKQIFDYVRSKDSHIHGDFLKGVMDTVKQLYGVSVETPAQVKELIAHRNFMFKTYNPKNLAKVTGRFCHPCINIVLQSMIFPLKSQGLSIGAQFIQELVATSPPEALDNYTDKQANYSAPVAAIAMACTLILHCLHVLEFEYTLKVVNKPRVNTRKVVAFEDRTYAVHYRTFMQELRGYSGLDQLRRFHMKPLLTLYANRFPDGVVNFVATL